MFFKQLSAKESTLTYFLGCGTLGKAVVVGDEQRFIDQAADAKVTITPVIDTHVHADHYSGGRKLAQLAGEILQTRHARGEISKKEYERMRRELQE